MPRTRPETVNSRTTKVEVACGNLRVTVGHDEHNHPIELIVTGSKEGTCKAQLEAISRLSSLAFRYEVPVAEVIDQLLKIRCHSCMVRNAKNKEGGSWSCPDAIAKVLQNIKS